MRWVIAGVIILCVFIILWPVLINLGRKALHHFKALDKELSDEDSTNISSKSNDDKL